MVLPRRSRLPTSAPHFRLPSGRAGRPWSSALLPGMTLDLTDQYNRKRNRRAPPRAGRHHNVEDDPQLTDRYFPVSARANGALAGACDRGETEFGAME